MKLALISGCQTLKRERGFPKDNSLWTTVFQRTIAYWVWALLRNPSLQVHKLQPQASSHMKCDFGFLFVDIRILSLNSKRKLNSYYFTIP